MGSSPHLWFCACKTATLALWITSLCMGPSPHLRFLHAKPATFGPEIACLYGSQNSPVIFCMQNSVPSFRIASLYGSQPSSVVFACKTATYEPEKQVSMGPRHHLSLCECKTALLAPDLLVSMCPNPCVFALCKTATFGLRITNLYGSQTSPVVLCMQYSEISTRITCLYGSQPLSVVFAMQNSDFWTQNYKSLWVPDITCRFVHAKQRD